MVRVADYIVNELYNHGVKHVFTVTGRGALFLTDALAAHDTIETVCTHHEQSAAFAAVAYSECNEKLGACIVSTGCAGTNTFTGILNAWQDGVPAVFISGQNKLKETSRYTGLKIRTYGQQEANLIPMVEPITKYATMISDPDKTVYEVSKALYLANHGRKGPVWIDVPLDVQNMRIEPDSQEKYDPKAEHVEDFNQLKAEDFGYVVESLTSAKRPAVLIGSGVRASKSIDLLKSFIEKNSIPVVYSASAPDTYGTGNDLSIGSVGPMACSRAGAFTIQNADLVLVIGCRMSSMTAGEFCKFGREAKVIVVDIDSLEHQKEGVNIDRFVQTDANVFLKKMNETSLPKTDETWVEKTAHWKNIFPVCEDKFQNKEKVDLYQLTEALSEVMPEKTVFHSDSGLIELILPPNIAFKKSQRCIHPVAQGSMGAALPSLIGSHYASPDSPILSVIGDGSIMMNLQEFETISHNKIPAKIIVVNNNVYSVIRKRQEELFAKRTIGTDPSNGVSCPDFAKVADTFRIKYQRIETPDELKDGLKTLFATEGPVLCEVMGVENQTYIHCSYTKNTKGRIVQRPIEDQSPFLDRELFLKEMIIDPIDQ